MPIRNVGDTEQRAAPCATCYALVPLSRLNAHNAALHTKQPKRRSTTTESEDASHG